jgi:hypothetical protein
VVITRRPTGLVKPCPPLYLEGPRSFYLKVLCRVHM